MDLESAKKLLLENGYILEDKYMDDMDDELGDKMKLDEALEVLKENGYLMEDNQPKMSRKNLRKWLTSKYGIEFNRMTIGTYVSRYVVNVPDDERQPITALKIEKYVKPINSAAMFDMFNEEGEETLTGGVQYEVSMEDITNYSKQEMAKYFSDLFAKDSVFWELRRLK